MIFLSEDRIKVDDYGHQTLLGTVITHDLRPPERVWVKLDGYDNPVWYSPHELDWA